MVNHDSVLEGSWCLDDQSKMHSNVFDWCCIFRLNLEVSAECRLF